MCLFYRIGIYVTIVVNFSYLGFSQNTFIPDDNFEQALIDLGLDTGPLNNFVLTTNISGINDLTIDNQNISDLTGIEDFAALTQLFVQNNQLTTIDVSSNRDLKILWCFNNQLSTIDVTQNTNLISFRCDANNLSTLNVDNNTSLSVLTCANNDIQTLNVSNNLDLTRLLCGNNRISGLSLLQNSMLTHLSCEKNRLTILNTKNNPRLTILNCADNQISELDLSSNSEIRELDCNNNQLCFLNISNVIISEVASMNFESNPNLSCVIVPDINGDFSSWLPTSFSNYVTSLEDCTGNTMVDNLNDFIGSSYTLPILNNGTYYSSPNGAGNMLNAGEIITASQTIYIYNEGTCFANESSFEVIISEKPYFIPRYFTPNNDGVHDFWNVIDSNNLVNTIAIYNRYGKLIKFLTPKTNGWDGTYNGKPLPIDSYWYEIVLNDNETIRGYFTLKR